MKDEASYVCEPAARRSSCPSTCRRGRARSTSSIARSAVARTSYTSRLVTAVTCGCGARGVGCCRFTRPQLHLPLRRRPAHPPLPPGGRRGRAACLGLQDRPRHRRAAGPAGDGDCGRGRLGGPCGADHRAGRGCVRRACPKPKTRDHNRRRAVGTGGEIPESPWSWRLFPCFLDYIQVSET